MRYSKLAVVVYVCFVQVILSHATQASADDVKPLLYGRVNISLEQRDMESTGTEQWELNSNASRLGIKGAASLSDTALTVIYQIEYAINVDDGADGSITIPANADPTEQRKSSPAPFSQRNTFAGLKGDFGQLIAGKFNTPLKTSEGKVDQFNDLYADFDVVIGGQNRANNIIQYSSPELVGNIILNTAFIPGEGTDVDADGQKDEGLADTISLSAVFDNKTIYAALAYEKNQTARRSADGINRGDIVRLVGGWKSGAMEFGALLQQTTDAVSASDNKDSSYLLSGAYAVDTLKYKFQFAQSKGDISDDKHTLTALGVDYALAKSTLLYTFLSSVNFDAADVTDTVFGVGLSHSF
jgi:hypothetical protein